MPTTINTILPDILYVLAIYVVAVTAAVVGRE